MLDVACGFAEEEIGEEAVAVGGHGDEVAVFIFDPLDDFFLGVAKGEFGVDGEAIALEFGLFFGEIGAVLADFFGVGVWAELARGPAVGDVEENQVAAAECGKGADVFKDGAVGIGGVEGDEDGVVHDGLLRGWGLAALSRRRPGGSSGAAGGEGIESAQDDRLRSEAADLVDEFASMEEERGRDGAEMVAEAEVAVIRSRQL